MKFRAVMKTLGEGFARLRKSMTATSKQLARASRLTHIHICHSCTHP